MIIALSLFSILFILWLLYISLSEKAISPISKPQTADPAKFAHDKLDQLNSILEIGENPEKAE